MKDGDPKVVPFRREVEPLPEDILPTAKFFSTLEGFDGEYSRTWSAREYFSWKGVTKIGESQGTIEVSHLKAETVVNIITSARADQWIIDESLIDCVTYRHKGIVLEPPFIGDLKINS